MRGDANIGHRPALRRHHVGAQTAVDGAHIHRHATLGIVEREQTLDHMGQLEDGAGAALGVEPGMGRLALDGDGETGDPLARGLEPAGRTQRGFQYEDANDPSRQPLDRAPAVTTADLFIRIDEQQRRDRRFRLETRKRLQRQDRLDDTAFHVIDAGTADPLALDLERHGLKRAERPHGVVVAQHQLRRGSATTCLWRHKQHAAAALPTQTTAAHAQTLKLGADQFPYLDLRAGLGGRRFALDHPAQQFDGEVPSRFDKFHDRGGSGHGIHGYFLMPAGNGNESD